MGSIDAAPTESGLDIRLRAIVEFSGVDLIRTDSVVWLALARAGVKNDLALPEFESDLLDPLSLEIPRSGLINGFADQEFKSDPISPSADRRIEWAVE